MERNQGLPHRLAGHPPRAGFRIPRRLPAGGLFPALLVLSLMAGLLAACAPRSGEGGPSGAAGAKAGSSKDLVIWTYDSFISEWGPGPEIAKRFLDQRGINITWVSHGDAGAMLSRLLLEGQDAGADILLGLDQNMADRALESGLLAPYKPEGAEAIFPELIVDSQYRLIPYDYGYFAIIYDSERVALPPGSLEDLTRPEYARRLILMDPRTSSPGLGFFGWTQAIYGESWADYWRRLKPSILTVAEGWDTGYGLFTAGEAPLVLSYTTSPGYHLEYEGSERYRAALFSEGHPLQIELAAQLGGAKNRENGERFLDFMITEGFQDLIPLRNWMYPAIPLTLPDAFRINPKSDNPLKPAPASPEDLDTWAALMAQP